MAGEDLNGKGLRQGKLKVKVPASSTGKRADQEVGISLERVPALSGRSPEEATVLAGQAAPAKVNR